MQKLLSGGLGFPQTWQTTSNFVPHFKQNLASTGLSDWHFGHFIVKAA
jgi:hypothetical protein